MPVPSCHLTDGKTEAQSPNLLCNPHPYIQHPYTGLPQTTHSLWCQNLPEWKQECLFQKLTHSSVLLWIDK